ncbi:DUF2167 domain-containing protein [Rhizobacter sp. LjRoot28]|jgi:uncharacterized membrane-anchored protein|uniref:DUF2167 domain-containing protein n=1 Tax=Rhizobacter sp. LjRoot28 TaxID=3342309 RepID=UPI003ECEEFF3
MTAALATAGQTARGEEPARNPLADLQWQAGPATLPLGAQASIALPEKTGALSEAESNKFLKLTGNLPSNGVHIVSGGNWWATFEYEDSGHIEDDEKIDADALLKQLKESDGPSNEERRKQGFPELHTDGWSVPPHYDAATRRLEWALRLHAADDPSPIVNYTVRVLGRTGYERVVLVTSPESLQTDVAEFKTVLARFDFNDGHKYGEFKQGDRVAQFGLAALVAGGAAAVATKTGFWKMIVGALAAGWKLVLVGVLAFAGALGKLFKRKGA